MGSAEWRWSGTDETEIDISILYLLRGVEGDLGVIMICSSEEERPGKRNRDLIHTWQRMECPPMTEQNWHHLASDQIESNEELVPEP
jgi:hypothetical protein